MIKKLGIILILILSIIMSANAVEVLNSCGKSSGWVNGETYLINFTTIDISYGGSSCFTFNKNGYLNDIIIEQITPKIELNKLGDFKLFDLGNTPTYLNNTIFKNINFDNKNKGNITFIYHDSAYGFLLINNFFENITLKCYEYNNCIFLDDTVFNNFVFDIRNNNFENLFLENYKFLQTNFTLSSPNGQTYNTFFENNNFENLFIKLSEKQKILSPITKKIISVTCRVPGGLPSTNCNLYARNNTMNNIIILGNENYLDNFFFLRAGAGGQLFQTNNIITNSIIKGLFQNDTNDNNIADSIQQLSIFFNTGVVYKDLFGYTFIQDATEGRIKFTSPNPNPYILVNNVDNVGSLAEIFNIENLDTSFGYVNFKEPAGIQFSSGFLDCGLINSIKCNMYDNDSSSFSDDKYRGFISTRQNVSINSINFYKYDIATNPHIITNRQLLTDNEYPIFELTNSNFYSNSSYYYARFFLVNGTPNVTTNYLYSVPMIRLKYNNIDINNNNFTMLNNPNYLIMYQYMDIESSLPESNKIYLNRFVNEEQGITNETYKSIIFGYDADTMFYNNFVGENVMVTNMVGNEPFEIVYPNLNITPIVPYYNEFDGLIYYFQIGNYYEDNVGCVDANLDDICDSPYQTGNVIDTKPLAVYPYNFALNIGDALYSSNPEYNITIHNIIDYENVTIPTATTPILFEFSQDSDLQNLICDYVLNGVVIGTKTNPEQNIIYNLTYSNWATQSYFLIVECYDSFNPELTYQASDIYPFNIIISEEEPEPPVNNGTIDLNGALNIGDIITGNPSNDAENILGIFNLASNFGGYLILFAFILMFISVIVLIFVILGMFIR